MDEHFVVYGDFNCPFCFALERRLAQLAQLPRLEWRIFEHMTDLPVEPQAATPAQVELLHGEVRTLRSRAPEVEIAIPRFRPSTRPAIELYAAALRLAPEAAGRFRSEVFSALWLEGLNIADPEVLAVVAANVGLPHLVGHERAAADRESWIAQWRHGKFDRIPALRSPHGAKLRGLPEPERLRVFLASGLFSSETAEHCTPRSG